MPTSGPARPGVFFRSTPRKPFSVSPLYYQVATVPDASRARARVGRLEITDNRQRGVYRATFYYNIPPHSLGRTGIERACSSRHQPSIEGPRLWPR